MCKTDFNKSQQYKSSQ